MTAVLVDSSGSMVQPSLHDARLVGVLLVSRERAVLSFIDVDESPVHLELVGIERLLIDELWVGNIVLDITLQSGNQVDADSIARMFDIAGNVGHAPFLNKMMKRIEDSELSLFRLNPSYGCKVECLCVGVVPISDDDAVSSAKRLFLPRKTAL